MAATTTEELEVSIQTRTRDLVVVDGKHSDENFDAITNRRIYESVEHERTFDYETANDTTTVAAVTKTFGIIFFTGEILEVAIFPVTAPTGGDLSFTVDIKKSTAGGAFTSVLSAPKQVPNGATNRTTLYATLSATTSLLQLARGDALQIVIAVSGSTGTQGAGVSVSVRCKVNPAA